MPLFSVDTLHKERSLYVSGKLPTYPSPSANFGLGEGLVGSLPKTYNDPERVRGKGTVSLENKVIFDWCGGTKNKKI